MSFQQIFILQVVVGAIFFAPFAIFGRREVLLSVEDFGSIFIVALIVIYGWMYMLLWGASTTSPIDASVISTLGPVFTLFVARIVSRQPMPWVKWLGAVVALAGAVVLLADKNRHLLGSAEEGFGNALVLCAVVAIAANTVLIKGQLERYGVLRVMGWYYIIGLSMALPFFGAEIGKIAFNTMPFVAQLELIYVLLLGSVLPMWLLYTGSAHLSAVHTALYRYVQPIVATALSVLRGQNNIDRANIIGAALIFVGVIFVVAGNIIGNRLMLRQEGNR